MLTLPFWAAGFGLALYEGVWDGLLKYASQNPGNKIALYSGIAGYGTMGYAVYRSLIGNKLALVNTAWDVMSHIVDFVIAFIVFKEKLNTTQMAGVALGVLGMVLMNQS